MKVNFCQILELQQKLEVLVNCIKRKEFNIDENRNISLQSPSGIIEVS